MSLGGRNEFLMVDAWRRGMIGPVPLPKLPLAFRDGIEFLFPQDLCCNCATRDGISSVVQDTRLTRINLLGDGSEFSFDLELPFCARCEPTKIKLFFLAMLAALGVFAIVFALGLRSESFWLTDNSAPISIGGGILVVALAFAWRPKLDGQTSYYQPVRIDLLRQELVSERVKRIRFSFSCPDYARAFRARNFDAICRGVVEIRTL